MLSSTTRPEILFYLIAMVVSVAQSEFNLLLLHTNDMHARFQETNAHSGPCTTGPCYGGFARLKTAVDKFREEARMEGRSSIFLNAGDTYQGTVFYTFFKHNIVSETINSMGIDVMSLGNHEFDDTPAGLTPFIANSTVPIVCCNIDYSKEPALNDQKDKLSKLVASKVLDVNGTKIGVIGYLTPETKFLAQTGEVQFLDEVEEISKEAARLKQEGVKILIAVGHSGYATDKKIAKEVPDLDVVVGGHTNTFLYNGNPPSIEKVEGAYPTVVTQPSGRKVPVVQAYAYTKYLGHLKLTFNDEGEVLHSEGIPVLIDDSFKKDETLDAIVLRYENKIKEEIGSKKVGHTKVFLEANLECRIRECNFGNLITDSLVFTSTKDHFSNNSWTDTPIAFIQGGGLRGSISNVQHPGGAVMMEDLMTTLPFENTIELLTVKGSTLLEVLEQSVASYSTEERKGGFLQYSGIQVTYDLSKLPYKRVVSAKVRCGDCIVPQFYNVDLKKSYNILMNSFLAQGGDGFQMLKTITKRKDLSFSDRFAVEEYMSQFKFIYPEISGRIQFIDNARLSPNSALTRTCDLGPLMMICTLLLSQSSTIFT